MAKGHKCQSPPHHFKFFKKRCELSELLDLKARLDENSTLMVLMGTSIRQLAKIRDSCHPKTKTPS